MLYSPTPPLMQELCEANLKIALNQRLLHKADNMPELVGSKQCIIYSIALGMCLDVYFQVSSALLSALMAPS